LALRDYTPETLLFRPSDDSADQGLVLNITPQLAGWDLLSFQVRRLGVADEWQLETREDELVFVTLSGVYTISSNCGTWPDVGRRESVFSGIAHTLYVPPNTRGVVTAKVAGEFAIARAPSKASNKPFLVTPENVATYIRGGDNATRQINQLIPPGAPVDRLVVVEVYTPAGSWSSFPPHKHDVHRVNDRGDIIEADLEEVYFYKIDGQNGYALQHIYTDAASPLHQSGHPIYALIKVASDEAVIVPEGYHPVASPPGCRTYYLNALAGSAQSLACAEDPRYSWIRTTYQTRDKRVPMYPLNQAPRFEN
jgi:5-deoxy-glucuronate isomerase